MKGLFNLDNFKEDKIVDIINNSLYFKTGNFKSYVGLTFASLFFEPSTRTQYSFEMAMRKLGIQVITMNAQTSSVQKGETLYDTVRTFESIGVDGFVIRSGEDNYYKQLENIKKPIFNGGDGKLNHPTQSLLDLMTIYEEYGHFDGLKVCIVGDIAHSRVAHTNIKIMQNLGMDVYITGPEEFNDNSCKFIEFDKAVEEMDVIMLLRIQFERFNRDEMQMTIEQYHSKYGLTMERVNRMKEKAIIMHPAPFNRGVEIADEVCECEKARIFKQMENGVYIRMAVISMVLDGKL